MFIEVNRGFFVLLNHRNLFKQNQSYSTTPTPGKITKIIQFYRAIVYN